MLAHLAPARRRLVQGITGLIVVGLVGGLVLALVLRAVADRPPATVDQAVPGLVLLVPGYGGSTQSLASLARSLRALGRDVTVVTLPDRGLGDLVAQSTALDVVARQVLNRTRAESVDVVGYSAGGTGSTCRTNGTAATASAAATTTGQRHGRVTPLTLRRESWCGTVPTMTAR